MFRTDPLKSNGCVDSEFFASYNYKEEQSKLIAYLEMEGFDDMDESFSIDYRGRKWYVTPDKQKKKKPKK
jgi:hypothetical protein